MKNIFLFCLILLISLATAASADFYTWEDENGVTHITDTPPPQHMKSQNMKVLRNEGQDRSAPNTDQATQTEKKAQIILFTKNECADCDKARDFLTSQKLAFTEYNMDKDKSAATKRKEFDDSSDVPFAVINRSLVYGFTEAVYKRAIKSTP